MLFNSDYGPNIVVVMLSQPEKITKVQKSDLRHTVHGYHAYTTDEMCDVQLSQSN